MTRVENRLSTIFCAVPAFIRVEPATTSSPVSIRIGCVETARIGAPALFETPIVSAPRVVASTKAATVNGVVPLAATPMTTSLAPTSAPRMRAVPSSLSSSAFSTAFRSAPSPPAMR